MKHRLHHVHLKSTDPTKTAEWYAQAFGFQVQSSQVRSFGDTFILCATADGAAQFVISGPMKDQSLPRGDANVHLGLEHFAMQTSDLDADLARLKAMGAPVLAGPTQVPNGPKFAFVQAPDDVRIELMQWPE